MNFVATEHRASRAPLNHFDAAARPAAARQSPAQAWSRALELTSQIVRHPNRILPKVVQELAERFGDAPALLSEGESLTYRTLARRTTHFGSWALEQKLTKGDAVCLLMPNCPEYMAIWLGVSGVGGVVALLNTNLTGNALAHSINTVSPKHLIVAAEFLDRVVAVRQNLAGAPEIWVHGPGGNQFPRIDCELERDSDVLAGVWHEAERRPVTIDDRALYIYTS